MIPDYHHTETARINERIRINAPMDLPDVIMHYMSQWRASRKREMMKVGERYYNVKNDILERRRTAIGENGQRVPVHNVADNRIAHAFARVLTDQKVQYLFGKPFVIKIDETKEEGGRYEECLNEYIDKGFARTLFNTAKDAVNMGIGWIYVHYDQSEEEGTGGSRLVFTRMNPLEMIPIWLDAEHTELDGMIRVYQDSEFIAKRQQIITRVEYWGLDTHRAFVLDGAALREDADRTMGGHFKADGKDGSWGKVPFAALKYNDEESPLIASIKSLIDDYDRIVSDDSNGLEDHPNNILVIHNYDGTDLGEFRRNLAAYRAVKVRDEGGVTALNSPPDIDASTKHLERLRESIYDFGKGLDTRRKEIGTAPSGVALKFQYNPLDMDCNQLETEAQSTFEQLLWFIHEDLAEAKGIEDARNRQAEILFNRDIIVNEEAAIAMCRDSEGIISQKTIVENHPWSEKDELDRMEREQIGADTQDTRLSIEEQDDA